jgi:hypothetical protein
MEKNSLRRPKLLNNEVVAPQEEEKQTLILFSSEMLL